MTGVVEEIYVTSEGSAAMERAEEVYAVERSAIGRRSLGRRSVERGGIEGDRYRSGARRS